MSRTRIRQASISPLEYPAMRPIMVPDTNASAALRQATASELRAA